VQTKQNPTVNTAVYDAGSTTRAPLSTEEMSLQIKDSKNLLWEYRTSLWRGKFLDVLKSGVLRLSWNLKWKQEMVLA